MDICEANCVTIMKFKEIRATSLSVLVLTRGSAALHLAEG